VMRDLGLVNYDEPFANLLTQGMVLNHIYLRKNDKGGITYFAPDEVEVAHDAHGRVEKATAKTDGQPVEYGGVGTMSKSKNNGVDPQVIIDEYGADTARLFMMFASPPEQTLEWSDTAVEGAARFLRRLWTFAYEHQGEISIGLKKTPVDVNTAPDDRKNWRREIHATLKQANFDLTRHQFNTVVSAAMKILNALERAPGAVIASSNVDVLAATQIVTLTIAEGVSFLLRLLSPITPHIAHHLWRELGYGDDILQARWPEPDPAVLAADEVELVVQVNGKLRGNIRVARDADRATIEKTALAEPNVQKHVGAQAVRKIVVVPGRLVNVVV